MDQDRILELDVLRGLAILLVMGVHVPAYPIWSAVGGWGVDLFFVLSGFLIANLLFTEYRKTGNIRFVRFFIRRALKLYPSFYILLALTVVYCCDRHVHFTGRQLLGEMLLTQNYIGAIWGHTWSLAVEEHFYILLPLLVAFMLKRRPGSSDPFRAIPYVFLGIGVACLALRIVNSMRYPLYSHPIHYEPSHLRFDTLFFGVFLAYLHNFHTGILQRLMTYPFRFPIAAVGVLSFIPAIFLSPTEPIVYTLGFTSIYFGFGTMLLLSIYKEPSGRPQPGFVFRSIGKIGTYSYTLYLWHLPTAQVFSTLASRFLTVNQYVLHAAYLTASIAIAVCLSKLIEIPVLRLRERLFPAPASGQPCPRVDAMAVSWTNRNKWAGRQELA
ncbi:MAG TPA: acyltransferase [Bryobacteraceae bacterium]|nr:acyltransferase [Bryobacteraceae bacterium]